MSEPDRLCVFHLGAQRYAVDLARVQEIVPLAPISLVAGLPPWVSGLVTLRDQVLPAVDLRPRFSVGPPPPRLKPKLLVCRVGPRAVAFAVDGVVEVARVPREALRPAPVPQAAQGAPVVLGAFGPAEQLTLLFNVKAVFAPGEGGR